VLVLNDKDLSAIDILTAVNVSIMGSALRLSDDLFLRNVCDHHQDYTASQPRRPHTMFIELERCERKRSWSKLG
jgi:hypothetical protein